MSSFYDRTAEEETRRFEMVQRQIAARGIKSPLVLAAMNRVPRELFLPEEVREFAYEDSPLPIGEQQTISQPYMVAYMLEALGLAGGERVLEIGTGSGYAAAVLAEISADVYTVERHQSLADNARKLLDQLGYKNIKVMDADGTRGWPEAAPYDAIVVAAGGPEVPRALKQQLSVGGRLVIPVGADRAQQKLMRITRLGDEDFQEEPLSDVRFVPLIGEDGWQPPEDGSHLQKKASFPNSREIPQRNAPTPQLIAKNAEPVGDIEQVRLDRLLERIGDSRVVLIGEASHGSSEFYRFRARITRELIEKKGFTFVAAEADWPDAKRIDNYVRGIRDAGSPWTAFSRFPEWMWRNEEVRDFVEWLRIHNKRAPSKEQQVAFYGLDLYSLYTSIEAVLTYLEGVDPNATEVAKERYGCLMPWQSNPSTYARAAATGRYAQCEQQVAAMLTDLLRKRAEYALQDENDFLDAVQNARLIANAEHYYRTIHSGYSASWNLRDRHMFETLEALLTHHGENSKAIIWEHNSHIGDASATDMTTRGQLNVGQLCREAFDGSAYLIGFGTHEGTVAAASHWGGTMEVKSVLPSLPDSWERTCHDSGVPSFMLPLRHAPEELRKRLNQTKLQRAIGVIYRPDSERTSHYFHARLASQFDEYVWFDRTCAIQPLPPHGTQGLPETYPFGI